jgi:hypothetical protein
MDIQSIIDSIVRVMTQIFNFIILHPQYILIAFVIIIVYALVNHVLFKTRGYQPHEKAQCELTLLGKERSLDYLKTFTHMEADQIAIINYLREHGTVPVGTLTKKYGKVHLQALIRNGYIVLR